MSKILIQRPTTVLPNESVVNPEIHTKTHIDTVVDTRYTSLTNLVVHVEGYPWVVNYYRQILAKSSSVAGQNITKNSIYQQYELIYKFVIKVMTPLSQNQDEQKKSFTLEGTGNIYPPMIPNVGDMFVADVGDGRAAIFEVTKATKRTIFKDSTYTIDYVATGYAEDERIIDLDNKTIKKSYFSTDFLENGQNPVIYDETYGLIKKIKQTYPVLLKKYLRTFFSEKHKCMVLPIDDKVVYDHFLTKAINNWYSNSDYPKLINLVVYNTEDNPIMQTLSIFDIMTNQDISSFDECFTKVKKLSTKYFIMDPRMIGLRYSSLDYVLYPVDYIETPDANMFRKKTLIDSVSPIGFEIDTSETGLVLDGVELLPRINLNESYIFSDDFYHMETNNISYLEAQILNYLKNDSIDANLLLMMTDNYSKWNKIQQFYLTPFVLTLLKAALRRF